MDVIIKTVFFGFVALIIGSVMGVVDANDIGLGALKPLIDPIVADMKVALNYLINEFSALVRNLSEKLGKTE
ncbi:hypothetical protein N9W34_02825 [Rickettsiales bacterium]|nr:hypothetical protein [Rickettsiales bacterium]